MQIVLLILALATTDAPGLAPDYYPPSPGQEDLPLPTRHDLPALLGASERNKIFRTYFLVPLKDDPSDDGEVTRHRAKLARAAQKRTNLN